MGRCPFAEEVRRTGIVVSGAGPAYCPVRRAQRAEAALSLYAVARQKSSKAAAS